MSFDINVERDKVVLPVGAKEGVVVTPEVSPQLTDLVESSFNPQVVGDSLRRVATAIATAPNLLNVARLLGFGYCVGQVSATADTTFPHTLGRVPTVIVQLADLAGGSGRVIGRPEGGSPNSQPWSQSAIFVRATVAGRYAFMVM